MVVEANEGQRSTFGRPASAIFCDVCCKYFDRRDAFLDHLRGDHLTLWLSRDPPAMEAYDSADIKSTTTAVPPLPGAGGGSAILPIEVRPSYRRRKSQSLQAEAGGGSGRNLNATTNSVQSFGGGRQRRKKRNVSGAAGTYNRCSPKRANANSSVGGYTGSTPGAAFKGKRRYRRRQQVSSRGTIARARRPPMHATGTGDFPFACHVEGCSAAFPRPQALGSHIYQQHRLVRNKDGTFCSRDD